MPSLLDHDLASLGKALADTDAKPVHAKKILRHFYATRGRPDFMSLSVGHAANDFLQSQCDRPAVLIDRHAAADGTVKLLLAMATGGTAECVMMPSHRAGVAAGCVSSQVGCAMGCDFCASTRGGLERNLTAVEIVDQFLHLADVSAASGRLLKTLVFMGMGEPLANFDAVIDAIRRIADPDLGGLGWRQITISTVGLVPGIDKLASLDLNVHLALSLHAPDDETRSRLVPSNRRYPVADVLAAAKRFHAATHRVPNIEYCLLAGVNDSDAQATLLADLLNGSRVHVNIIPYNAIGQGISGITYQRPTPQAVARFVQLLRDRGTVTHVRQTRGDDVNAACGQLRRRLKVL